MYVKYNKSENAVYLIPNDPYQNLYVPFEEKSPVKWMKENARNYAILPAWSKIKWYDVVGMWHITLKQLAA